MARDGKRRDKWQERIGEEPIDLEKMPTRGTKDGECFDGT